MRRRGKTIALATAAVGLAVLVTAGFLFRNRILELWYLHRVKTENDWSVLSERLGELESNDAVAYFFGEMARLEPGAIGLSATSSFNKDDDDRFEGCGFALITMFEKMGKERSLSMMTTILKSQGVDIPTRAIILRELGRARKEFGQQVTSILVDALKEPQALLRANAAAALGELDPKPQEAIPWLTKVLGDTDETVRHAAAEALKKIQGTQDEADSKTITLSTAAGSLVVLVVAGLVLKDPILERWYLYQLEHGDEEARKRAIEGLEEVGRAQREQWEDTGPAPAPEVAQDLATIYRPAAQRASCRLRQMLPLWPRS